MTAVAIVAMVWASTVGARVVQVGGPDYPTLAAAIAAVPTIKAGLRPGESLQLVLPPGATRLTTAVVIGAAQGGASGAPLVIRGAADGSSYLTGAAVARSRPARATDAPGLPIPPGTIAVDLSGTSAPDDLDRRGPHATQPTLSLQLYQGQHWLPPSRWPASGYATGMTSGTNAGGPLVVLPPVMGRALQSEPDLWAAGYWGADWEYERAPVQAVTNGVVHMAPLQAKQPVRPKIRFRIENAVSTLTAGHVALLPSRKLALVAPAAGGGAIEVTVAPSLLRLDHAAHVKITGLGIERSGGDAVQIASSSDVAIEDCWVRDAAGTGILVIGGTGVAIRRTIVAGTGERGVLLSGGARATLTASGNAFEDGVVADFGRLSPSYRPGVELLGVGNRVSGSVVSGGDHSGIVLGGNNNVVTDNEVRGVLRDAEDSGAIYMGADWSQRGNIISGNYIHNLGDPARPTLFQIGVYLDDQFSGAQVTGNVIEGGDYGVAIGGGRDNVVTGNLFVGPSRGGVSMDARGITNQLGQKAQFARKLQAMPFTSPAWRAQYPTLATLDPAHYGEPDGDVVQDNLLVRAGGTNVPLLDGAPAARGYVTTANNRQAAAGQAVPSPFAKVVRKRAPALQMKLEN